MNFISIEYIIFLGFLVALYYIFPLKKRWIVLLIGSYAFYYFSSGKLLFFLILSTLSIYASGLLIDRENIKLKISDDSLSPEDKKKLKNESKNKKKLIVLGSIIFNFGILVFLKYSPFIFSNINPILNKLSLKPLPITKFILPIGISYYTLMAVSYVVDVYRGKYKADENLGRVALFLPFFPQIIEGPICNYADTADKLYNGNKFELNNLERGFFLIVLGVFKVLVVARRTGIFVDSVLSSNPTGFIIFFAAAFYTLQIYADFSGCMDIVCGSAKMFNVDLLENFRRPFFSRSVQEFWRRWHITLGVWIKNYIFYPVSLSKMNMKVSGFFKKKFPKWLGSFLVVAFPLLFVWLYNGIWHGSSWKYIFYGMYYYILIMIGILFAPVTSKLKELLKLKDNNKWLIVIDVLRTVLLVIIGMLIFRSHSLETFFTLFSNMFKKGSINLYAFGLVKLDIIIILVYLAFLLIIGLLKEYECKICQKIYDNDYARFAMLIVLALGIVILGIYGSGYDAASFIYGQF